MGWLVNRREACKRDGVNSIACFLSAECAINSKESKRTCLVKKLFG